MGFTLYTDERSESETWTPAPDNPVQVMRKCLEAHRAQDWDELRRLFHPRAKIGVFAGGGLPSDPEKALADMKAAHSDVLYQADVQTARELDEHAVVLKGRVRYRLDAGGFIDAERSWLYVVVHGRLIDPDVPYVHRGGAGLHDLRPRSGRRVVNRVTPTV